MPATYVETIEKLQQQSLETLKQAQAVQLAALASFRDIIATVPAAPAVPSFDKLPSVTELTELGVSFAKKFVEQQTAFATELVGVLTPVQKDAASAFDRAAQTAPKTVQTATK